MTRHKKIPYYEKERKLAKELHEDYITLLVKKINELVDAVNNLNDNVFK